MGGLVGIVLPSLALLAGAGACVRPDAPAPLRVAVATNFARPFEEIARAYEEAGGSPVEVVSGSTGKLFAQIENGAPFDLFLAADEERPRLAVEQGLALAGSRFTYAEGRLALVGEGAGRGAEALREGRFEHLALAQPAIAPYGAAAVEVLEALGLRQALESKQVLGESVAQALQFVDAGAAELGFVAGSQVLDRRADQRWLVPPELHAPLRQDAVVLARAGPGSEAHALAAFLRGERARAVIEAYGYGLPRG